MSLKLRAVSQAYRSDRMVIDSIDLEVADGDRLAIMGPSGSGKTTILSILGLLVEPTQGTVLIDGVPAPLSESARHAVRSQVFAWVLQSVNVLGRRTAVENVAIALMANGYSRRHATAEALKALAMVGLESHADQPVRLLSGGEVQRVCVARALVRRPKYLLADEPTGQLDHSTSLEVMAALSQLLSETGTTLVVATHDDTVAASCNRVVNLMDGKVHTQ